MLSTPTLGARGRVCTVCDVTEPTRNPHAGTPFDDDDAAIAVALEDVSIPALLCSLVHMTGDPSWVRGELRPQGAMINEHQGYMSEDAKAEVRALNDSPLGALVADRRRAERRGYRSRLEHLDEEVEAAVAQLTGVRDFVRDFAQGRMPLNTFLEGPSGTNPFDDDDEHDVFLEFVGMVEQLERSLSTARAPARKAKGTAGRSKR